MSAARACVVTLELDGVERIIRLDGNWRADEPAEILGAALDEISLPAELKRDAEIVELEHLPKLRELEASS